MKKEVFDIRNHLIKNLLVMDYYYDAANKNREPFFQLLNLEYDRINIFLTRAAQQVYDFSWKCRCESDHHFDTIFDSHHHVCR